MTTVDNTIESTTIIVTAITSPDTVLVDTTVVGKVGVTKDKDPAAISPEAFPVPLALVAFPERPPTPIVDVVVPMSLVTMSVVPVAFLLSSFLADP